MGLFCIYSQGLTPPGWNTLPLRGMQQTEIKQNSGLNLDKLSTQKNKGKSIGHRTVVFNPASSGSDRFSDSNKTGLPVSFFWHLVGLDRFEQLESVDRITR